MRFGPDLHTPVGLGVVKGTRLDGDRKSTTSELQSRLHLVCRLLLEKKNKIIKRDSSFVYSMCTETGCLQPSASIRSYADHAPVACAVLPLLSPCNLTCWLQCSMP